MIHSSMKSDDNNSIVLVINGSTQYGTIINLRECENEVQSSDEELVPLLQIDTFHPLHTLKAKNKNDDKTAYKSMPLKYNISSRRVLFALIAGFIVSIVVMTISILLFLRYLNYSHYDDVNFSLRRVDYTALDYFDDAYETPFLKYAILSEHTAVIEPSQKMELHFYSDDYGAKYKYTACKRNNECQTRVYESEDYQEYLLLDCDPFDTFTISLYRVYPFLNDYSQLIASETAICMYVRREYRDLTAEDKSMFLDTMHVMSTTSQEVGQALYGDNFMNFTYISKFHYFNSAQRDADHIHEGNGFLMQHIKFTNWFDSSLRAIKSDQSTPYWDFTIDAENSCDSTTVVLSSADDFGTISSPASLSIGYAYDTDKISDGRIIDGRWANLTVNQNSFYDDLKSGYGYLRSPWGLNPSPYISRFAFNYNISLPSCTDHYDLLQFTNMMDFFVESSFQPHGSVHTVLGGFYGCNKLFELVETGYIYSQQDAIKICSSWDFFMKELYRDGLISPYNNCSVSSVSLEDSRCGFTCKDTIEARQNISDFLMPRILENADTSIPDAQPVWLNFICGGGGGQVFTGDHLESSSAADPSFWVIHGSLERLLHAKMLAGGFETSDWATDPSTDYICDRSTCYNDTLGYKLAADSCCYGHHRDDQMLDAINGDRWSYVGETNNEILTATNASSSSYSMPYIYDKLSWNHCSDTADIDSLLLELYNTNALTSSAPTTKPKQFSISKKQDELRKKKAMKVEEFRKAAGLPP